MLPDLPVYLAAGFILVVLLCLAFVFGLIRGLDNRKAVVVSGVLLLWIALQSILTLRGLYHADPSAVPPKIILFGVMPAIAGILAVFLTRSGRAFIDGLSIGPLTFLHVIRVPVELVLYGLFLYGAVPELMTFEGRNFDILAGISAPIIAYFGISRGMLARRTLLVWNFLCLVLLLNIVVNAVLSVPSPFQQFALDQPNIAILYFPFSLLPGFVVPVVLFSHLAAIRKLLLLK